ncbi:MAG TPA: PQQ-binding-like beta-propeller repeat protein [Thermoplasmata archaeon]|nr:PQQ-binding-like beta-propeller repeat protein [Thermoplasmata archaeon]
MVRSRLVLGAAVLFAILLAVPVGLAMHPSGPLALGASAAAVTPSGAGRSGAWTQTRANSAQTGLSTLDGPTTSSVDWLLTIAKSRFPSEAPVQSPDGTIYTAVGDLTGVSPNGTRIGSFQGGGGGPGANRGSPVEHDPAVTSAGDVIVGTERSRLYSIAPSFTMNWQSPLANVLKTFFQSNMTVGPSNQIFLVLSDGKLFDLRSDGHPVWSATVAGLVNGSPAIGPGGDVYVGSSNGLLYAFHANGTPEWSYATGGAIVSDPAVGPGGLVVVTTLAGRVVAVHPNGTLAWTYSAGVGLRASPAIDANGSVYVGTTFGTFLALSSTGSFRWAYNVSGKIVGSAAVDAAGRVYFGAENANVYALSSAGALLWQASVGAAVTTSPAIGMGNELLVMTSGGDLYAFGQHDHVAVTFTETGLPNGTAWSVTFNHVAVTTRATHVSYVVTATAYLGWSVPVLACGSGCEYAPATASGTVSIPRGATSVAVSVSFSHDYLVHLVLVAGGVRSSYAYWWLPANASTKLTAPTYSPYGFVNWTSMTPLIVVAHPTVATTWVYVGAPGALWINYT